MSVGFSFINCIHDLFGTANKTFGATLHYRGSNNIANFIHKIVLEYQGGNAIMDFTHLHIRYSIFIFMDREIGLGY